MKASLSFLLVLFVLAPAGRSQAQQPCGGAIIDWKQSEEKARDSSLNSTYYYPAGAETFARAFQGTNSYVVAIDIETKMNIAALCQVVQNQQIQLDALQTEISALRKRVNAGTRKDSAAAPKR